MQSFGRPRPTTNPYITMLARALTGTEGVELVHFRWRTALLGRYDVFHFHWPETLLGGRSWWRRAARRTLFVLLLLRLTVRSVPVVRTVHNLELPEVGRFERWLLALVERRATFRIRLSEATVLAPDQPHRTILHGHYRDWFADLPAAEPEPGRMAFVGLIRRYKGVETLLAAFAGTSRRPEGGRLRLTVAGKPSSPDLGEQVREAARQDPRITTQLAFLDDAQLVAAVTGASLVVLPYRQMHNSGATLAALSLDRAVLVPDNEANRLLAAEVGAGWVHRFTGELSAEQLTGTLAELHRSPPAGSPDLGRRDWDDTGAQHRAAYLSALGARQRRR